MRVRSSDACAASTSWTLASPKSRTFARPDAVTMMFAGFTSRCVMPRCCAAASASATSIPIRSRRSSGTPPRGIDLAQRLAVHQLHRQQQPSVVLLDGVDGDDAGMIERGDGLRLALEALPRVRVAREHAGQDFQRDPPVQARVLRDEHLAHAALAERLDDPVVPDGVARLHAGGILSATLRRCWVLGAWSVVPGATPMLNSGRRRGSHACVADCSAHLVGGAADHRPAWTRQSASADARRCGRREERDGRHQGARSQRRGPGAAPCGRVGPRRRLSQCAHRQHRSRGRVRSRRAACGPLHHCRHPRRVPPRGVRSAAPRRTRHAARSRRRRHAREDRSDDGARRRRQRTRGGRNRRSRRQRAGLGAADALLRGAAAARAPGQRAHRRHRTVSRRVDRARGGTSSGRISARRGRPTTTRRRSATRLRFFRARRIRRTRNA